MKWIGILLMIGCVFGIGFVRCDRERRAVSQGEGVLSLLRQLREQIRLFLMPLSDIFAQWDGKVDGGRFDALIRENGLPSALSLAGEELLIDCEMFSLLSDFCQKLGKNDASAEIALCDFTISRAEEILSREKDALAMNIKVIRTLTVASAVLALILFL